MKSFLKKKFPIFEIFDNQQWYLILYLIIIVIASSIFEFTALLLIIPFVSLIIDPSGAQLSSHKIGEILFSSNNLNPFDVFLFCFIGILISIFIKWFSQYFQGYVYNNLEFQLSKKFFSEYIKIKYSSFLGLKKADIGRQSVSDIGHALNVGVLSIIVLFSQISTFLFIFFGLLVVNTKAASGLFLFLGFLAIAYIFVTKSIFSENGKVRHQSNVKRFQVASDAFKFFKAISINNSSSLWVNEFSKAGKMFCDSQISQNTLMTFPKLLLEVAIISIVFFSLLIFDNRISLSNLPLMAAFFYGGYRLAPSISSMLGCIGTLKFAKSVVKELLNSYRFLQTDKSESLAKLTFAKTERSPVVEFKDVSFGYTNTEVMFIKNASFLIKLGSIVGFRGKSGSGKTTLVDLLLGLIQPVEGKIIFSPKIGSSLNNKINIGYVGHEGYVINGSVEDNLRITNPDAKKQQLLDTCLTVGLFDTIPNLTKDLSLHIGEDGNTLSTGQIQRIAIARELLKETPLIIFDEAFSALDIESEKKIFQNISKKHKGISILLISHRQTSYDICDKIFDIKKGQIIPRFNDDE